MQNYFQGTNKGQAVSSAILREAYFYMLEAPNGSARPNPGAQAPEEQQPTEGQKSEFTRRYEILKVLCDESPQKQNILDMRGEENIVLPEIQGLAQISPALENIAENEREQVTNAIIAIAIADQDNLQNQWLQSGGSNQRLNQSYAPDIINRPQPEENGEQNLDGAVIIDPEQEDPQRELINKYTTILLSLRNAENTQKMQQAQYDLLRLVRYRDGYDNLSSREQKGMDGLLRYYLAAHGEGQTTQMQPGNIDKMKAYIAKIDENPRTQNYSIELQQIRSECFQALKKEVARYETKENDISGFGKPDHQSRFGLAYGHDWTMSPSRDSSFEDKIEYLGRQTWMMSCGIHRETDEKVIRYAMDMYEKHRQYLENFYRSELNEKKLAGADFADLDKIAQPHSRILMHQVALGKKEWLTVHVKDVKGTKEKSPGDICDEYLKLCRIGDEDWIKRLSEGVEKYKPLERDSSHMGKGYKFKKGVKRVGDALVSAVNWVADYSSIGWPMKIFITAIFPLYILLDPKLFDIVMGIKGKVEGVFKGVGKAGRGVIAAGIAIGGFCSKTNEKGWFQRTKSRFSNAKKAVSEYWNDKYPKIKPQDQASRDGYSGLYKLGRIQKDGNILNSAEADIRKKEARRERGGGNGVGSEEQAYGQANRAADDRIAPNLRLGENGGGGQPVVVEAPNGDGVGQNQAQQVQGGPGIEVQQPVVVEAPNVRQNPGQGGQEQQVQRDGVNVLEQARNIANGALVQVENGQGGPNPAQNRPVGPAQNQGGGIAR